MPDITLPVAEDTLVGRKVGGHVDDLTPAEVKTLLGLGTAAGNNTGDFDAAGAAAAVVSDAAYNAGTWDAVTGVAPSKNAVRDKVELLAPLASPALTGTPTAPTAGQGTNTTQLATTAYVQTEVGLLIPKSLVDAKGDLLVGTANDTVARLAVGADGTLLTADSASPGGVKWNSAGVVYTDEQAQDAVGAMIADTATVDLAYVDATPALTATVIDDSITNAKLANMAQSTIRGRAAAAGTGDPQDLTAAQVKTILALAAADISDFDTQVAVTAILKSLVDAKGDLLVGTADNTVGRLAVGANDTILMADSAAGSGAKWVAPATPSTQAFGDAAAEGTADTFVRGDHKHAMPALGTGATNATAGNDSRLKKPTRQILTVGSGTYTTPSGCTRILITVVGGGAGGGGTAGSATLGGAAAGGGSGGWLTKAIDSPAATYAYTAGAKGAGGVAGNNNGSAGSDSTFGAAGTLLTAKGGGVGNGGGTAGSAVNARHGGDGGGIATDASGGGSFMASGGCSGYTGVLISATVGQSGAGGSTPWGGGGVSRQTDGAGVAPVGGYGGGGGGALTLSVNTNRAGGDGADGVIFVDEYYGT